MRRALAWIMPGLLLIAADAHAAAWTLKAGEGQILNNVYYYNSDRFIDSAGHGIEQPDYNKIEYNPYIEYGLSDSATIGISPSFQYVRQDIPGVDEENANLADTEFFFRKRLFFDGENVIALQPLVKIPGPYDKSDFPVLGQDQVDAELRLLYGRSFGQGLRHYVNLEAAYRFRAEAPDDELRFASTLGYRLNDRWQLLGEVNATISLGDDSAAAPLLANSLDYDLVKLQLSAIYWLTPLDALQFGLYHSVWERNTGEGGGFLISYWYRF